MLESFSMSRSVFSIFFFVLYYFVRVSSLFFFLSLSLHKHKHKKNTHAKAALNPVFYAFYLSRRQLKKLLYYVDTRI